MSIVLMPAMQALNAVFSKEQAEVLKALIAAAAGQSPDVKIEDVEGLVDVLNNYEVVIGHQENMLNSHQSRLNSQEEALDNHGTLLSQHTDAINNHETRIEALENPEG